MPREKKGYRDQLEYLLDYFGPVGLLTKHQVADYLGRSPRYVKDRLGIGREGVTLPVLARRLLALCDE